MVAILEVFNGLGLMLGPIIGGILYEIGGFRLPFYFMGSLLFLMFIIAYFAFPSINTSSHSSINQNHNLSLFPLIKTPRFILTLQMVIN